MPLTLTLVVRVVVVCALQFFQETGKLMPVFISGTIVDQSGRTLSGQTGTSTGPRVCFCVCMVCVW